jgi:tRNA threonylcarbamoyl adenosine modification protein YeaZ
MTHLFIDTATERGIIGLAESGILLAELKIPCGFQSSKNLIAALLDLIKISDCTLKDLSAIGIGIGPGSYTGIRTGASLAQALAYGLKIPLVPFSSLKSFAPSGPGLYATMFDARHGGVYLEIASGPKKMALDQVEKQLGDVKIILTPHITTLKPKLAFLKDIAWQEAEPSGQRIAFLMHEAFKKGDTCKAAELKVLYLESVLSS